MGMHCEGEAYLPVFEFHFERKLRQKYQLDTSLFSTNGKVIFADFRAVRLFVHKINQQRDPRIHIYPGEVNAAGLLEEIFHLILRQYEQKANPNAFKKALDYLQKNLGKEELQKLLYDLQDKFPNTPVYTGQISINGWLEASTQNRPNSHIALEEAIMLFFANFNPANHKIKEFFDDKHLSQPQTFRLAIDLLEDFFEEQPGFGPNNTDIFSLFKTPILAAPNDISQQIGFILENWKTFLPETIITQLLKGKDLLREDVRFDTMAHGGDGVPTMAPVYKGTPADTSAFTLGKSGYNYMDDATRDYEEHDAFTPDVHWMPSVVMMAKNTYVWLDQLSKKYQHDIRTLDQIPDQELDILRNHNFNALWLIGIWERSDASRRIKHIMGNTDAVSSAYSLYDYQIAHDLGGEQAYHNLNERAKARGIRLASDMVPNHTGIYSQWVVEHPEYFIQTQHPPFPGYSFSGENLSQHPDLEIRIEDGYFSKTDAAVVFQRIDKRSGNISYLYHGNDGTVMPWNDTAQLDMIKAEVREAVIQKIFEVARKFSIIRFDAAMTLAKKHFSRLWYPRPGTGGDIPSRADYAMSQKEFDTLFPVEFWREVVDRMNQQMPETLLLAEAFWFMEGYFVRTLGMHRVYNSAFMHMLKNEENEKYRDLITNTLEFEPEILKRYVNFMSNPDEETAIRQFGTGDKYFGVCVLMNTLPGLPMFAHGQIEGYTEKYGMEYQRAYYNEDPNPWLVEKHQREIFPITAKRYLFSEVYNFNIFDYIDAYGNVNENVFAFTNRHHHEKALVLYNNKYEQTQGRIHFSAPRLSQAPGSEKQSLTLSLANALDIDTSENVYLIFREHFSGLEYIKKTSDIDHNGFHWNLNGFEYRLFWEFRQVHDTSGEYEKVFWKAGNGLPSIDQAIQQARLQPLHSSLEALFAEDIINFMINRVMEESHTKTEKLGYTLLKGRFEEFAAQLRNFTQLQQLNPQALAESFMAKVKSVENTFSFLFQANELQRQLRLRYGIAGVDHLLTIGSKAQYRENMIVLMAAFALKTIAAETGMEKFMQWQDQLLLRWPLENLLQRTGRGQQAIQRDIQLIVILCHPWQLFDFSALDPQMLQTPQGVEKRKKILTQKAQQAVQMLAHDHIAQFIGANNYQEVIYYSKESYEELIAWLYTTSILDYFTLLDDTLSLGEKQKLQMLIDQNTEFSLQATQLSARSGYRLANLVRLLQQNPENNPAK